ncbi:MAG: metal-dependent transcriptional regulator [Chloroflexi bacterium]|nr:metal-dependent transcriptional regulator [Chloroflexota bacterium]
MASSEVSESVEEYLETLHYMELEGKPVIGARVAEWRGVKPPSVVAMVRKLSEAGLVTMNERKEIVLTGRGQEMARTIVRRHRLVERLLTDVLGLDWSTAHEEACRIEHAISAEVEQKLEVLLGHPTHCPHGNPIPGTAGITAPDAILLENVKPGDTMVVERISERAESDARLLEFYQRTGLVPGTEIVVLDVATYAGTLTLLVKGIEVSVGIPAADKIWVRPLS